MRERVSISSAGVIRILQKKCGAEGDLQKLADSYVAVKDFKP